MGWGIRITIIYVGFVALIVSLVTVSISNKSELVAKDYYAQELAYQKRIDAISNEQALPVSIESKVEDQFIVLSFPAKEIGKDFSGEAFFFRPSDSSKDLKVKLQFGTDGEQHIEKKILTKGVYKLCVTWNNNKTTYYKEQIINI
jgi:nitrogen fixation protein FixH